MVPKSVSTTSTEENYLKAIYKLSERNQSSASTNAIATLMQTSAASVTDMLKRLSEKELIHYEKYRGVHLTASGRKVAIHLLRKHRLWETFLVEKLDFSWDEVHPMAEQLEHIQSVDLIDRLEAFLGFPKFDPHGDPIPDKDGNFLHHQLLITALDLNSKAVIVGVKDHSPPFLRYVEQLNLTLGTEVEVLERFDYDQSVRIRINKKEEQLITFKVSNNLYVQLVE